MFTLPIIRDYHTSERVPYIFIAILHFQQHVVIENYITELPYLLQREKEAKV